MARFTCLRGDDMSLQYLIETYGYWALFAGTFLEGETVLIMAGFAAHRGYLELPWVIVVAFLGSFAGDQFYFFVGRTRGQALLAKRPRWKAKVNRVYEMMHRYQTPFLIGFRFMTGLRTITPLVIGMTPMKTPRFVALNAIGAALWAATFGTAGYLFGNAMETFLKDVRHFELHALVVILVLGLIPWIRYLVRQKKRKEGTV